MSVLKSASILDQIKNHLAAGLSPSALNKYLSCPLDYYYRYVVGLGEMDEMEEDIQSSTFGTCIHNTLEKLHKQDLKKSISPEILKTYLKQANQILEAEFLEFYNSADLKRGKNLLTFEAAKKQVEKFLRYEMQLSAKEELIHLSCESSVQAELTVQMESEEIPVKLKGKVDGILSLGGSQLLLDYKTGKVEEKDLSLDSEKLFEKLSSYTKALQLLSYAYQYYISNPNANEISPCIYSFKNGSAGFIFLKLNKEKITKTEVLELYPKVIQHIVRDLLNSTLNFEHESDSKYCQYCTSL